MRTKRIAASSSSPKKLCSNLSCCKVLTSSTYHSFLINVTFFNVSSSISSLPFLKVYGDITSNKIVIREKVPYQEEINYLNEFFTSIGSKMNAHLTTKSFLKTIDKTEKPMFLTDIKDEEVFDIINNAPKKCNEDCYDLNYNCIKKFSNVLSPFLSNWFNKCFILGVFPNCLKFAKAVPLQKSEERVDYQFSGIFPYYQR